MEYVTYPSQPPALTSKSNQSQCDFFGHDGIKRSHDYDLDWVSAIDINFSVTAAGLRWKQQFRQTRRAEMTKERI